MKNAIHRARMKLASLLIGETTFVKNAIIGKDGVPVTVTGDFAHLENLTFFQDDWEGSPSQKFSGAFNAQGEVTGDPLVGKLLAAHGGPGDGLSGGPLLVRKMLGKQEGEG